MKNIIEEFEKEKLRKDIPLFRSGDFLKIKIWVLEGSKKRLQTFKGIVISIKKKGLNSSFTVRKISYNEGIERVFFVHSPSIYEIEIIRNNSVRKAKLYFLRKRFGKSVKIKERINFK